MKLHKMKVYPGFIESVVTVTPEILENLAKIKLSKVARALFFFKHKKINLMEAELKAPGRDLAYLIKLKDKF